MKGLTNLTHKNITTRKERVEGWIFLALILLLSWILYEPGEGIERSKLNPPKYIFKEGKKKGQVIVEQIWDLQPGQPYELHYIPRGWRVVIENEKGERQ